MSTEITRELLQTTPLADLPGWEVRLFLITYPPGADANNHSHPVVGVGFVLEGVMVSAFDDDSEETFLAGQSFVDRASYHRIVRNDSKTRPMRFLIAYTVKTGEPNTVFPNDISAIHPLAAPPRCAVESVMSEQLERLKPRAIAVTQVCFTVLAPHPNRITMLGPQSVSLRPFVLACA